MFEDGTEWAGTHGYPFAIKMHPAGLQTSLSVSGWTQTFKTATEKSLDSDLHPLP